MNQSRVMKQLATIRAAPRCDARRESAVPASQPMACFTAGAAPGRRGRANGNFAMGEFNAEAIQERQWLKSVASAYGKVAKA